MAVIRKKLQEVGAEAYNIRNVDRNAPHLLKLSIEALEKKSGEDIEAAISRGIEQHYRNR